MDGQNLKLYMLRGAFMDSVSSTLPRNFYLPQGLVEISEYAFYNNDSDTIAFKLPSTIETIGNLSFAGTEIASSFNLTPQHPSLKSIGVMAFAQSDIYGTLQAPATTTISSSAFTRSFWSYPLYINGRTYHGLANDPHMGTYDFDSLNTE